MAIVTGAIISVDVYLGLIELSRLTLALNYVSN